MATVSRGDFMSRCYIKLFFDWSDLTHELTPEEKGRLIDGVIAYARGDPVSLDGNERFVFPALSTRIDRDNEKYAAIVQRNQDNGRNGGRPIKCETQPNPEHPSGLFWNPDNPTKAKKEDGRNKIPPISPEGGNAPDDLSERFDRFWSVYPRKVAKQNAVRAWNKLRPDEALTRQILDAVERFKLDPQWSKEDGQFIPYPSSFLNGRRWEDVLSAQSPPEDPKAQCSAVDLNSLYAPGGEGLEFAGFRRP